VCNPQMLLAAQAAGAGMDAVGAYGAAKSQKSSLRFAAQAADLNATLAERRAQIALEQGAYQAGEIERAGAREVSGQRATFAARGAALGEGSALAVMSGTELTTAEDARQARINATRAAWGYRTDATNSSNEAIAARANARAINPGMAGFTSLLGSAVSIGQNFYAMKGAGAFDRNAPAAGRAGARAAGNAARGVSRGFGATGVALRGAARGYR